MSEIQDKFDLDELCENEYDNEKIERMYQFPASIKEAEVHRRATRFGYNSTKMKDGSPVPICPCCENPVNTVPIPLCYGTSPGPIVAGEPKFLLNSGTAMYFIFIKMCIAYLLMRFIIADGFNLYTSYKGHFCKLNPKQCTGDYNSYLSGYNKHTQQDQKFVNIVDYLNIAVTIASIIFFYFCRKYQFKLNSILQHSNISQDQFSVYIENIPIFIYQEDTTTKDVKFEYQELIKNKISEEIKTWVEQIREYKDEKQIKDYIDKDFYKFVIKKNENLGNEPVVTSISLCYDLAEMESLAKLRQELMEEYIEDEQVDINNIEVDDKLKHIPNQISIINAKYIQLSKKFALDNSPAFNLSHFLGKAFVTFNYQHYRQYFLREAAKDEDFFQLQNKSIQISRPSQPQDVFWTNLKVENEERADTVKQSFVVLIIILLMSLVVLVGVDQLQVILGKKVGVDSTTDQPGIDTDSALDNASAALSAGGSLLNPNNLYQQFIKYLFVVLIPVITNFVNFVITFAIEKLTQLQRHKTKTHKVSSFIVKNIIARFINTAIIYFILSLLHKEIGPITQQGFVVKVMGLVGVSALIQFLTELFRPEVVLECIKNALKKCFCPNPPEDAEGNEDQEKLFQIQLNEQKQDPQFAFAQQYTFYLVQIWLVSFYAIMVPAAIGILVILFTAQYWVDKYNLFRKFSCPLDFNFFLSRLAFKGFECSLFVFAVGTFIFDMEIRTTQEPKYKLINLVSIILSAAYLYVAVFGPDKLEVAIFSEEEDLNSRPYGYYKYEKKCFRRTYWTENPATIFLKERNINDPEKVVEMPPDDKFVKPEEFDKYIALTDNDIVYQVYENLDENVFKNYGNDDYNEDYDQCQSSEEQA